METKTPILSLFLSILYVFQFKRCTHLVTTSLPPSKRSGILFAKRKTLNPGFTSRPPSETQASTTSGCPPQAKAGAQNDAIHSGPSSFMMPKRRLYSPAGERHEPSGSSKRASAKSCCILVACLSVTSDGCMSVSKP